MTENTNSKAETEALLQQSKKREKELEQLFSYAADGIVKIACDPDFTILFISDGLANLIGTSHEEIKRKYMLGTSFVHPKDAPYVSEEIHKAIKIGMPFQMQFRIKHLSGKDIWTKVKGGFTTDQYEDKYPIMFLVYTDITELVDGNEILKIEANRYKEFTKITSEEFSEVTVDSDNEDINYLLRMAKIKDKELESIFAYAADGMGKFACDPNFTILFYNEGLANLVGTTRGRIEKEGFNSSTYIHPDDIAYVQEITAKALYDGKPFELRYRLKHLSGKDVWTKVNGAFVAELYQNKYPIMFLIYTDITELVLANQAIEIEANRYKAFTGLVNEQFFEYNADNVTNPMVLFGNSDENSQKIIPHQQNIQLFYEAFNHVTGSMDDEIVFYDENHEPYYHHIKASGIYQREDNWVRIIGKIENISEKKIEQVELKKRELELITQAQSDYLTGLLNRHALQKRVEEKMINHRLCMCAVIDIDNFKKMNDTYGHIFGDEVLQYVANTLKDACSDTDMVGRIGGDEFFLFFDEPISSQNTEKRLNHIISMVYGNVSVLSHEISVSISIGGTLEILNSSTSFKEMYARADEALYSAKKKGKNTFSLVDSQTAF